MSESNGTYHSVHRVTDSQLLRGEANTENTGNPVNHCEDCEDCEHWDSVNPVTTVNTVISESWLKEVLPEAKLKYDSDFRLAVFHLARYLKSTDCRNHEAAQLKPFVKEWQEAAGSLLAGRTFTDVYSTFVGCWATVHTPYKEDVVAKAWAAVQEAGAEPTGYDDSRVDLLAALCRELQRVGGGQFFLSGRTAASLLAVTQPTASQWLNMLVADGILEVVATGGGFKGGRRQAREYRIASPPAPQYP